MIAAATAALLLAQAQLPPPVPQAPARADARPAADDEGPALYRKSCASCHGEDGRARTRRGRKLHADDFGSSRWQSRRTDERIAEQIAAGVPKKKMPAFRDRLSPGQIRSLVTVLRSFAPPRTGKGLPTP